MTNLAQSARWQGVDLQTAPADDPVAFGGGLSTPELLAAYRAGVFPMPADGDGGALINRTLYEADVASGRIRSLPGCADPYQLAWHCPDPIPVIAVDDVHLGRELRRLLRNRHRWHTSANRRFAEVVSACAGDRKPVWLTTELQAGMARLHQAGWAHSIEVWDGNRLIGGVFGVGVGAVFSADSMFHTVPDASKVAIADLADRLRTTTVRLVAVQTFSEHTVAAGAAGLDRRRYLSIVAEYTDPVALDARRQPAARLAPPANPRPRPLPRNGETR